MKLIVRFLFVLLVVLIGGTVTFSQDIFFNKVLPPDGRSFMHVTGMVQDRQGYMWFTTKKGLFRYDGYQWISFKHNPLDSTSLASDALEAITIDHDGIIW